MFYLGALNDDFVTDRGIRTYIGVAQPRAGPDHGRAAHDARLEPGGRVDRDRALDAGIHELSLDGTALQPLQREAVALQQRLGALAVAPPLGDLLERDLAAQLLQ